MGKLTDTVASAPRPMANSVASKVPTSEQIRMAQLLVDPKSDDHSILKDKVQKVMELTRCDENSALIALHDCDNDVEHAVDKLLEGGQVEDEWILQEGKKARKVHHPSHLEDSAAIAGDDCDGTGVKSSNRRGRGNYQGRSAADGPPRVRGRSRGMFNKENDSRGDSDGTERFGYPRGRGRGFGARDTSERGARGRGRGRGRGFGGNRDDRRDGGFSENGGGGGFAQIDSWTSSPAENNTWDNSMASTLNSESAGEWGKRSGVGEKKAWENSAAQANDYDWGGEEDLSKLRDGLIVEPSYVQKSPEKPMPGVNDSVAAAPAATLNHAPRSADVARIRGESIDVNSLFTSNQTPGNSPALSSPDAWTTSKQATADLKHELGIGKAAGMVDNVGSSHRPVPSTTPSKLQAAKVELPLGRAPASICPIDVQFGDMTLSSETSQPLCEMNVSIGYQQPSSVTSQRKDAVHESARQHSSNTVYQRTVAGGDHANGPALSMTGQGTDKGEHRSSYAAGTASFVPSHADQQSVQQHKPPPQQQQQLPLSLQQQQFPGSRGAHSGVAQMASALPQKTGNTGMGGVANDHQRPHLMPSTNAAPTSSQQTLVESAQQFMRDETGVPTNASYNMQAQAQAMSKNQITSGGQPMGPYQQAMPNMVPYLGMAYDQSALNSFGYLHQSLLLNAGGLDMRTVNPLSGANITVGRDASDMKAHMMRQENGSAGATGALAGNVNVPPPGLPAPTVSNAEHAAQLMNLGLLHQLQFLNPAGSPYMQPQFYVPNVSSASAATTGSQYQRGGGYQTAPALFGATGYEEMQQMQAQQDYGKAAYSVMPPPPAQGKSMSAAGGPPSAMALGGSDVGNKYGGGMKMAYDSKQFANATATPPPLGSMNFSPAATGPAQYGYPSYLPQVMSMMTAPAMPSNAQLSNDLLSQRAVNQNGKPPGGPNTVAKAMSQQYQYGGQWGNN